LAIDGDIRLADQHAERINLPSNPEHFWNYRMHITLEELLKKDAFNAHVRNLTKVR
jgi:4-alpha-glucanotransferase